MTRPLVFLFPGQSSRDPEMLARLGELAPEPARAAIEHYERLLGRPFDGAFGSNLEVQLAVRPAGAAGAGSKPAAGKSPGATKTDDASKGGKAPASTGTSQQPKTQ